MAKDSETESVQAQLTRILASPSFASAERASRLLKFLVEETLAGRGEQTKEYSVGLDAFDKSSSFDPRTDSTVRTEVSKLRTRLASYYAGEGGSDPCIVTIPKGGYSVIWDHRRPDKRAASGTRTAVYVVAAILVLALAGYWFRSNRREAPLRLVPLTSYPGWVSAASFSPDGTHVAFDWRQETGGPSHIYAKVIGSAESLQLTAGPGNDMFPVWSPDGASIAFARFEGSAAEGSTRFANLPGESSVWVVPSLGGLSKKVCRLGSTYTSRGRGRITAWWPDAKSLVISDLFSDVISGQEGLSRQMQLLRVSLDGGQREVLTHPPPGVMGDFEPMVSPDGEWIAFFRRTVNVSRDVYILRISSGEMRQLTFDNARHSGIAWSPDSREVIFGSTRSASNGIWRVPISGSDGPTPVITTGFLADEVAVAPRGGRVACTQVNHRIDLWTAKLEPDGQLAGEPRELMASTRVHLSPHYSPDGRRIAFFSDRSGSQEIWVTGNNGEGATQLTSFGGPQTGSPRWSPDGTRIAFDSTPGGNPDIYVIAADGGSLRRITNHPDSDAIPSWSTDGKWIYFSSRRTGRTEIWKTSADDSSGPAIQITRNGGSAPEQLGGFIYYSPGPGLPGLKRVPVDGGEESVVAATIPSNWGYWETGRKGIYVLEKDEMLLLSPDGKSKRTLFRLPQTGNAQTKVFGISANGDSLVFTHAGHSSSDVMLIENFR